MARTFLVTLALAVVCLSGGPTDAQTQQFQVGVLPNVSARVILTSYQPFQKFFERELGRTVEIATAPHFKAFHQRTMAKEFDIVVTAANLGRVAELDAGLRPIAIYEPAIPAVMVMTKAKPVGEIAALKGRQIAMANPQSLVALKGIRWLRGQGLEMGRDVSPIHARNEDSLAQLLGSGEAPLALMSMGEFRAIREDIRATLEIWREIVQVPGFLVLLGKPMAPADAGAVERAFASFPGSDEGKQFFALSGFRNIRPVSAAELQSLDDVVEETRRNLSD
jgi:phosphonate transport system substrate-binding protein